LHRSQLYFKGTVYSFLIRPLMRLA